MRGFVIILAFTVFFIAVLQVAAFRNQCMVRKNGVSSQPRTGLWIGPKATSFRFNELYSTSSEQDETKMDTEPPSVLTKARDTLRDAIRGNIFFRPFANTYEFFYWFPRKNLPYDSPWQLLRNSTVEWLAWYQLPHNLPPYGYLGKHHPDDFFCWGLPGNTLPLGNWDPWGMQLVTPKVVKRYRESELKHGRLAMLATVGVLVQEAWHPLHTSQHMGGLAIYHMQMLRELPIQESVLYRMLIAPIASLLQINSADIAQLNLPSLDYWAIMYVLMSFEAYLFVRNWSRWDRNEYNHQFDHNIGLGNLKEVCRTDRYAC